MPLALAMPAIATLNPDLTSSHFRCLNLVDPSVITLRPPTFSDKLGQCPPTDETVPVKFTCWAGGGVGAGGGGGGVGGEGAAA